MISTKWSLLMRSLVLAILVSVAVSNNCIAAADVSLAVRLNKESYKINDDFIIEILIPNNGKNSIRVLPWKMFPDEWFDVIDSSGRVLSAEHLIVSCLWNDFPSPDDYVVIQGGKVHTEILRGKVVKDTGSLSVDKESSNAEGLSSAAAVKLYLGNVNTSNPDQMRAIASSKVVLPEAGTYYLRAKFEQQDFICKEGRDKFGIEDMWCGSVSSGKVKFILSE